MPENRTGQHTGQASRTTRPPREPEAELRKQEKEYINRKRAKYNSTMREDLDAIVKAAGTMILPDGLRFQRLDAQAQIDRAHDRFLSGATDISTFERELEVAVRAEDAAPHPVAAVKEDTNKAYDQAKADMIVRFLQLWSLLIGVYILIQWW